MAAGQQFNPIAWLGVAVAGYEATRAILTSLVQTMQPIDYVTAVVLAVHPDGMTRADLERQVKVFLDRPDLVEFSWHFGMNVERARRAREMLAADWFEATIRQLQRDGFVKLEGEQLVFVPRHYTIGWASE